MDFSQLNHLKVADLKQHLKQRGLSIVGNKSDLIQRLGTALVQESQLPTAQEQHPESKVQQQEIDEDAILGDDDDDSSSIPIIGNLKHSVDSLIQNEDLLLSETSITNPSTTTNMLKTTTTTLTTIKPQTTTTVPSSNNRIQTSNTSTMTKTSTSANNLPTSIAPSNVDETSQNASSTNKNTTKSVIPSLKQLIKNKHPLTSEERKRMRTMKFADPKLVNRAERFGIATKGSEPSENEKILQRIQRFGEVVSSVGKTAEEKQRLERRKERFGVTGSTNSGISSKKGPLSDNIKKRQERFGVVEKPATKHVTVFKRRRFAS